MLVVNVLALVFLLNLSRKAIFLLLWLNLLFQFAQVGQWTVVCNLICSLQVTKTYFSLNKLGLCYDRKQLISTVL